MQVNRRCYSGRKGRLVVGAPSICCRCELYWPAFLYRVTLRLSMPLGWNLWQGPRRSPPTSSRPPEPSFGIAPSLRKRMLLLPAIPVKCCMLLLELPIATVRRYGCVCFFRPLPWLPSALYGFTLDSGTFLLPPTVIQLFYTWLRYSRTIEQNCHMNSLKTQHADANKLLSS